MRNTLLAAACLAAFAVPVVAPAADQPEGGPPPPPGDIGGPPAGPPQRPGLFISPSGEPFRGGDGRAAWFAGADADRDGVLSLAEFRADAMRFFKALDIDGDGVISGGENQRYEKEIAPEIARMALDDRSPRGEGGQRGGMGGPPGGGDRGAKRGGGKGAISREGAARFSMLNEPQPVRGGDLNLDYRVTAEEWSKTAGKRFALLDKDGDGRLTLETLPSPPRRGRPGDMNTMTPRPR